MIGDNLVNSEMIICLLFFKKQVEYADVVSKQNKWEDYIVILN